MLIYEILVFGGDKCDYKRVIAVTQPKYNLNVINTKPELSEPYVEALISALPQ